MNKPKTPMSKEKKEITWICAECGKKYGNRECGIATWHEAVCDICGKKTEVTEPRDFGYTNKKKLSKLKANK